MKHLYKLILHWIRFDLWLAQRTGRNPTHIGQLKYEQMTYDGLLLNLEINE